MKHHHTLLKDVSVNVPAEYLEQFIQIMEVGLERVKMSSKMRKVMNEWWSVERHYLHPE
jgi:hypothetical protein